MRNVEFLANGGAVRIWELLIGVHRDRAVIARLEHE